LDLGRQRRRRQPRIRRDSHVIDRFGPELEAHYSFARLEIAGRLDQAGDLLRAQYSAARRSVYLGYGMESVGKRRFNVLTED
jgi:hypothetical protein